MKPFDEYPSRGMKLLGRLKSSGGRSGVLVFRSLTRQSDCALCGVPCDDPQWPAARVRRVVSAAESRRLGVPSSFFDDCANMILVCSACDAVVSDVEIPDELLRKRQFSRLDEFLELRDRVCLELKHAAAQRLHRKTHSREVQLEAA